MLRPDQYVEDGIALAPPDVGPEELAYLEVRCSGVLLVDHHLVA